MSSGNFSAHSSPIVFQLNSCSLTLHICRLVFSTDSRILLCRFIDLFACVVASLWYFAPQLPGASAFLNTTSVYSIQFDFPSLYQNPESQSDNRLPHLFPFLGDHSLTCPVFIVRRQFFHVFCPVF